MNWKKYFIQFITPSHIPNHARLPPDWLRFYAGAANLKEPSSCLAVLLDATQTGNSPRAPSLNVQALGGYALLTLLCC